MIQKAKRTLAMLMAAVMLCGLLPVSAMATTTEQDPVDSTTTPVVTEQPEVTEQPDVTEQPATETPAPSETVLPTEQPEESIPEEETPTAGLPEEVVEPYALTYEELLTDTAQKGQPFASGTLDSENFRIPALVTLSDGTLVAAADARWNHTQDGQNTDTMVAVSKDNGQSWNVSLVNYFADTEDKQTSGAASFIDPALATDGETVYLLVDVFPGGVDNLNACEEGTGYNNTGYLMLSNNGGSSYDYYVGEFTNGYAPVMSSTGATEYAVDERYDLYKKNENGEYIAENYRNDGDDGAYIAANVFYKGATFTVYPTSYLWLVKSENGGETWSAPQILNDDVKNGSESFYGVGPGRGLVTSDGTIYFSCYTHKATIGDIFGAKDEKSSLIYSTDGGKTWKRTENLESSGSSSSKWSSENQVVQLDDGTIRMFYRNGRGVMCYVDLNDNGSWGSPVSLESTMASIGNQYICSDCQLSVIHYSQTIDGKEAILVSCPSDGRKWSTGDRNNGKIFAFTVNEDNTLTAAYSYQVNTGDFQYSCLTELDDGSIGILYEESSGTITYKNISINAILGKPEEEQTHFEDSPTGVAAELPSGTGVTGMTVKEAASVDGIDGEYVAYDITFATENGTYTNSATVTIPLTEELQACNVLTGFVVNEDGTITYCSGTRNDNNTYTFNCPHFSTVGVMELANMETEEITVYVGRSKTITDTTGNYENNYNDSGLNKDIATVTVKGTTTEGGTVATPVTSVSDGDSYVIQVSNGTYLNASGKETTDPGQAAEWTLEGRNEGYRLKNGNSYLMRYNSGSLTTTTTSRQATTFYFNEGTFYATRTSNSYSGYKYSNSIGSPVTLSTSEPVDATEITFTGVAVGETSVVVGNTRYNIRVEEAPPFVDVDSTPFTSETGNYSGNKVTKLTTSTNMSYDLNVSGIGINGTWSIADTNIATVDQSGKVTGKTAGETTLTYTVNGNSYTIPIVVIDDTNGKTTYTCDLYIDEISNTTVTYSINLSTNLLDAQEGEAIYLGFNYPFCINFFGLEDEGYGLTYMSATYTSNLYYALYPVSNLLELTAYREGALYNQRIDGITGWATAVDALLNYTIDEGYHGTMGWTRSKSNGNINSNLTFRSQKLPTVTKEIVSVGGEDYTEGMTAKAGDVITYKVTVTQYATTEEIAYTDVTLKDTLVGATFTGYSGDTVRPSLSDDTLQKDETYKYEVTYTIKDSDLDTDIVNTVELTYNYKAQYSSGSFGGSAEAQAKISAPTFDPYDIVIDFGLPVTIDYSGDNAHGRYDLESGTALYGDVEVNGNKVTYTPTSALKDVDTVTLTNTAGASYTFDVYPATTVYYDASFVNGVTVTEPVMEFYQTASAVGSKDHYGYEAGYNDAGYSNSAFGTLPNNGTATFTFTGTGVDIYANPTSNSCYVAVRIYKGKELVHLYVVDTAMVAGSSSYTTVPTGPSYNVPIVSELGLTYGTYTVEIDRVNPDRYNSGEQAGSVQRDDVVLNGFRVYGTLASDTGDSVYTQDNEASPTFTQLRDVLINTLWKTYSPSADLDQQYDQVYANPKESNISANIEGLSDAADAQDLLLNGPKNEIYLTKDQELTITVPAGNYQIGLKALDAESGTVSINDATNTTVTNVDMFYEVTVDGSKEITIKNTSESAMIAVTYLKKTGN